MVNQENFQETITDEELTHYGGTLSVLTGLHERRILLLRRRWEGYVADGHWESGCLTRRLRRLEFMSMPPRLLMGLYKDACLLRGVGLRKPSVSEVRYLAGDNVETWTGRSTKGGKISAGP